MKLRFTSVKQEQGVWAMIFLFAPLLLLGIFVFFPIVFAFVVSFYDWNLLIPDKPFVGLANYSELFKDEVFIISVKNTIVYTIGVVPTQTFAALFLAFVMNQKIKGRTFFRIAFYVPAITSSVVTSIIFVWIYSKPGLLNYLLASIGIDSQIDWLTNPNTVLPSIMMLNIWTTSGFFMVSFLAGLQSIPQSLYEAAKIDGANTWQQFWNITVPMVRPITFFVMVMSLIGCFQVFDQIFIMSGGGPDNASTTMSYFVYQNSFKYFRFGFGAASAVVLACIIFASTYLQKKYFPSEAY
ncbi:MAG: sugar ABC transporter permease [Bacteroidota bacterium]